MTSYGGPRWAVDHLAEHASGTELGARRGCVGCLASWLAIAQHGDQGAYNRRMHGIGYPWADFHPGARCRLWSHPKATVATWSLPDQLSRPREIDSYACACGKRVWLSADGARAQRVR